uniref:DUF2325 domain-containing protein n=1 Tax=Rubinisphaera brasiliensis (strain ATCC 49424 / DSM 5305 / JCM 21570 / IAM 15109 / NBRC 103401 / IFAM 1448) TaxID=756272 RepID=F0SKR9_RUBBR|nr:hypothetical protein Plabr_1123 [Rubinisphaera brasiliensis DSM 5305]
MDILTHATSSFRRRLLGLAAKDARFRSEVRHFAKALISDLSDAEGSDGDPKDDPFSKNVIARCRLKSEAARWRAYRAADASGIGMTDAEWSLMRGELLDQGQDLNCHLWMLNESLDVFDIEALEALAGCYDTLAEALELINDFAVHIPHHRRVAESLFRMLATIQSALRTAVSQVGGPEDQEQRAAFGWLRTMAEESRIFIRQHMKQDDPAEPESWIAVSEQIEAFRLLRRKEDERLMVTEGLFDDLFALTERLNDADSAGVATLWDEIVLVVEELVVNGVPPSSLELRELLRPHLTSAPSTTGFIQFERVRKQILSIPKSAIVASCARPTPSKPVEEVRKLLQGRSAVLIGAHERPHHRDAITNQFGLKELIWIRTNHGTSVKSFAPAVANEDVAVVLLTIRWASHSFGDVQVYCDRYGKPLVRLPGGYSPDQLAHQILTQCGDRLEAARSANGQ